MLLKVLKFKTLKFFINNKIKKPKNQHFIFLQSITHVFLRIMKSGLMNLAGKNRCSIYHFFTITFSNAQSSALKSLMM